MQPEFTQLHGKTVCLISSGHLGSNPRLVKEADALHAAGATVQIISLDITQIEHVLARDDAVIAAAPWPCTRVQAKGTWGRIIRAVFRRLGLATFRAGLRPIRLVWWAYNPVIGSLARAACAVRADLYIAHNLAALPAAYQAARRHGVKLGFDAEDFHSGELPDFPENALTRDLVCALEQHYLPRCDYLTAASPGIAKAYAAAYGVPVPTVILNVFPLADAPVAPSDHGAAQPSPSLYWFSQTIGPDRGLETVVAAIARSQSRPFLFLRGNSSPGYQKALSALAEQLGVGDQLRFLAPALPGEMVSLAAEYDLGLASEPGHSPNNRIALSNKLFTYLLAGLPTLASATTAQAELAADLPDAVFVYPQQDARVLAEIMDELLLSPFRLASARRAAWQLGQERFNWDSEQAGLLKVVAAALAS